MNKPGNIWWGRNVGDPCRVGFTDLLLQIIDDKGNIQPPNTEGNIGIRIKPTRPIGLFMYYEVRTHHLLPNRLPESSQGVV